MDGGIEWILDVQDCASSRLSGPAGEASLRGLFSDLIAALDLHPVAPATWHVFPEPAGVTGLVALAESHLACHSFPEAHYLSLNVYSCRTRPEPNWQAILESRLGPCRAIVRRLERGAQSPQPHPQR